MNEQRFRVKPAHTDGGLQFWQVVDTVDRLRVMCFTREALALAAVRRLEMEHRALERRRLAS